jgi:hypothetical protein
MSTKGQNKTQSPESASELYRSSDRRLSAKLVPTLRTVDVAWSARRIPYGCILGFLERTTKRRSSNNNSVITETETVSPNSINRLGSVAET